MICSHNTFTYRKPLKWWMYLFVPFAKCQHRDIAIQAKRGVQMADIRLKYHNNDWFISHGPIRYCTLDLAIYILKLYKINKVRLLFEGKLPDKDILNLLMCKLERTGLTFYEGRDKNTWEQVLPLPSLKNFTQYCGSMLSKYGKVFPWLFYSINKKKLKDKLFFAYNKKVEIESFDFV